jgi:hypothetical protein
MTEEIMQIFVDAGLVKRDDVPPSGGHALGLSSRTSLFKQYREAMRKGDLRRAADILKKAAQVEERSLRLRVVEGGTVGTFLIGLGVYLIFGFGSGDLSPPVVISLLVAGVVATRLLFVTLIYPFLFSTWLHQEIFIGNEITPHQIPLLDFKSHEYARLQLFWLALRLGLRNFFWTYGGLADLHDRHNGNALESGKPIGITSSRRSNQDISLPDNIHWIETQSGTITEKAIVAGFIRKNSTLRTLLEAVTNHLTQIYISIANTETSYETWDTNLKVSFPNVRNVSHVIVLNQKELCDESVSEKNLVRMATMIAAAKLHYFSEPAYTELRSKRGENVYDALLPALSYGSFVSAILETTGDQVTARELIREYVAMIPTGFQSKTGSAVAYAMSYLAGPIVFAKQRRDLPWDIGNDLDEKFTSFLEPSQRDAIISLVNSTMAPSLKKSPKTKLPGWFDVPTLDASLQQLLEGIPRLVGEGGGSPAGAILDENTPRTLDGHGISVVWVEKRAPLKESHEVWNKSWVAIYSSLVMTLPIGYWDMGLCGVVSATVVLAVVWTIICLQVDKHRNEIAFPTDDGIYLTRVPTIVDMLRITRDHVGYYGFPLALFYATGSIVLIFDPFYGILTHALLLPLGFFLAPYIMGVLHTYRNSHLKANHPAGVQSDPLEALADAYVHALRSAQKGVNVRAADVAKMWTVGPRGVDGKGGLTNLLEEDENQDKLIALIKTKLAASEGAAPTFAEARDTAIKIDGYDFTALKGIVGESNLLLDVQIQNKRDLEAAFPIIEAALRAVWPDNTLFIPVKTEMLMPLNRKLIGLYHGRYKFVTSPTGFHTNGVFNLELALDRMVEEFNGKGAIESLCVGLQGDYIASIKKLEGAHVKLIALDLVLDGFLGTVLSAEVSEKIRRFAQALVAA